MAINPIFWLHLRLGSNRRNIIVVPAAFAILVIGISAFSYYVSDPASYGGLASVWLALLSAAQVGFLLLVGPSDVRLEQIQLGLVVAVIIDLLVVQGH